MDACSPEAAVLGLLSFPVAKSAVAKVISLTHPPPAGNRSTFLNGQSFQVAISECDIANNDVCEMEGMEVRTA
jgi:hypothetical protein